PTVVRLALAKGETTLARAATQACQDYAGENPAPPVTAAAQRCRGMLDSDRSELRGAADAYRAIGYLPATAETLEELAVAHASHGSPQAAATAYAEAVEIYQMLDATLDITRADTRLRPYGIGGNPRGARVRPAFGWHALTPTELKVARLVGRGL